MLACHPKLAITAFLNLDNLEVSGKPISHFNYGEKLKKCNNLPIKLHDPIPEKNSLRHKENYDKKVRFSRLKIGYRVLVRLLAKTGKCKFSDNGKKTNM